MPEYATESRLTQYGIVLALYPSTVAAGIEIQRAPDSGGAADTGNAESIAVVPPGQRTFTDLRAGGTWWYRIRHVFAGATASSWTDWVSGTPTQIPPVLPQIPDVGGWIIKHGKLESTDGNITLDAPNETITIGSATAPLTGTGIFLGSDGAAGHDFRAGNPAGNFVHWDESAGTLSISGEVTAASGSIGGWGITATDIVSGNVALESDNERILVGSATAPLTGTGIFIGLDGADYELRVGNPAGAYIHWTGSTLNIQGAVIQSPGTGTDIALLGWGHNLVFSATDHDTVAWASGTITLQNGGTYSISAGNTGTMAGVTYVYLDTAVSSTVLQTTATQANSVGVNKILVAVCAPVASGKDAEFQVFGGSGSVGLSKLLTSDNIATNTLTANEIAANTITGTEISSLSISGKTITADTGSVGGWTLAAGSLSSGNVTIDATNEVIRLGATAFLSGAAGVWMGEDGAGGYDFRVGDPAGEYIYFDASAGTFEVSVENFVGTDPAFEARLNVTNASNGAKVIIMEGNGSTGGLIRFRGPDALTDIGTISIIGTDEATADFEIRANQDLILAAGTGSTVIRTEDAFQIGSSGTAIESILHSEHTVSWGSVPASSTSSNQDVTVTGAAVGDAVLVSYVTGGWGAFPLVGRVSAADTVKIYAINPETSARTHNSVTVKVTVIKT